MKINERTLVTADWEQKYDEAKAAPILPARILLSWWTDQQTADLNVGDVYRNRSYTADELEQVAEMIYDMAKKMRRHSV